MSKPAQQPNLIETPSVETHRARRERVAATFIQNWPDALAALSMPTKGFPIEDDERHAMIAALWASASGEEPPEDVRGGLHHDRIRPLLDGLAGRLDPLIRSFAGDPSADGTTGHAFVRLGSRSPKDSWEGIRNGFGVRTGAEAMALLIDSMERVHDDLQVDRACGVESWLFVRQWVDLPQWAEFRCVLRDGYFCGASQYAYMEGAEYPQILSAPDVVLGALAAFADRVRDASHLDTVIFDVGFEGGDLERPILIEINPFSDMTDLCLFRAGWPDIPANQPVFRYHGDGNDYGIGKSRSDWIRR